MSSLLILPERPLVLAYYYVWYGKGGHEWSKSLYHPELGGYNSSDPSVIKQHILWARSSGIDGFIVSWWGRGTYEDGVTKEVFEMADAGDFKLAIMIERVGNNPDWYAGGHDFDDQTYTQALKRDLVYVVDNYVKPFNETYLKFNGRYVIVLYAFIDPDHQQDAKFYAEYFDSLKRYVYEQTGVRIGFWSLNTVDARCFDLCAIYLPTQAEDNPQNPMGNKTVYRCKSGVRVAVNFPMFDNSPVSDDPIRVPPDDGRPYRDRWRRILMSMPRVVLITSWNEWHESTAIEPSLEWGDKWLQMTKLYAERLKTSVMVAKCSMMTTAVVLLILSAWLYVYLARKEATSGHGGPWVEAQSRRLRGGAKPR